MRAFSKLTIGLLATVFSLGALFIGSAAAATTLGSTCLGTLGPGNLQMNLANATAQSSGVITSWGATFDSDESGSQLVFLVVEPTGVPNQWRVVHSSGVQAVSTGPNGSKFTTHTPISAGQTFAVDGAVPTCSAPGSTLLAASNPGPPAAGDVFTTASVADSTPATWANVEPDIDGDGYGDETQDKCPQSKDAVLACPLVKPVATQLKAKNAFKLLLTTDLASTATATGTVTLPKTKKSKSKILTISGKPTAMTPGLLSTVTLSYPAKLKAALALLSHKKSLKLAVSVNVDGPLAGPIDAAVLTYTQKIKGLAK